MSALRGLIEGQSAWQESADRFYMQNGPCCAGCDHWQSLGPTVGECTRSAPVSSTERLAMIGIERCSLAPSCGHALTKREHVCGEFSDGFDWSSLPLAYRKKIGDRSLRALSSSPTVGKEQP